MDQLKFHTQRLRVSGLRPTKQRLTICKVLFDRKEGGYFIGRTEHDSPDVDNEVLVDAENTYIRIGDFTNVIVKKADHFDLYGEIVK